MPVSRESALELARQSGMKEPIALSRDPPLGPTPRRSTRFVIVAVTASLIDAPTGQEIWRQHRTAAPVPTPGTITLGIGLCGRRSGRSSSSYWLLSACPGASPTLRRNNACRILLASAGCFLALALAVLLVDPFPGDAWARLWVLGFGSPGVVQVARLINHLGSWQVLLPLTLGLFVAFPRARRRWWIWLGLMIAAPAAEGLLKILIGRARPEEASMGFPSGHATAAAAFFGAVIYLAASLRRAPAPACEPRVSS